MASGNVIGKMLCNILGRVDASVAIEYAEHRAELAETYPLNVSARASGTMVRAPAIAPISPGQYGRRLRGSSALGRVPGAVGYRSSCVSFLPCHDSVCDCMANAT